MTAFKIKNIIRGVFVLFNAALLTAGCKIPALPGSKPVSMMPSTYRDVTDTVNSSQLKWEDFYSSQPLRNIIDTVLANNPDMQIAFARIQYSQAQLKQASGLLLPQVNALVSPSLRKFGQYTMDGAGNIATDIESGKRVPVNLPDYFLGFQSSWEIDLWGKLKNRKKASLSRALATESYRNLLKTNLIAETASTYYDLMAVEQGIKTLDQTIELQNQALEIMRIQKEAAVVNELAVQQFEAQLYGMKALRVQLLQRIIESENKLNVLAGKPLGIIRRDSSIFQTQLLPVVHVGLPGQILLNRPDIRQTELELLAASADLRSARAAFLPSVVITGSLGTQAYLPSLLKTFPESIAYNIIGGITMPFLNKRNIKAEFAKASAQQKEALINYQKNIFQGYLEVDQELKRSRRLMELVDLKKQEVKILTNSVAVAADLFKTGRSTYLEVLFARQNQLRSNLELIETQKAQWISTVNLYKTLGGGWR
ncbi:MAG: hypothetical protein RLY16_104 [Bacteroidota bacterium]|jgi:NodT family efflux transporter outer membrane factor (OMF) lipoprotein